MRLFQHDLLLDRSVLLSDLASARGCESINAL